MRQTLLDFFEIKAILNDPSVSKYICDDSAYNLEELIRYYLTNPEIIVLRPLKGSCFIFVPWGQCVYEGHIAVVKGSERNVVKATSTSVVHWMFDNTNAQKLIVRVPSYNKAAIALARYFGKQEGLVTKSFYKFNKVYDQLLFGLTKEEFQCQQQSH